MAAAPIVRDDGRMGVDAVVMSGRSFERSSDGLFAASLALAGLAHDTAPAAAIVADWMNRASSSNPDSWRRYPWPIDSRFNRHSSPPSSEWTAWHRSEEGIWQRDPARFESRLILPPILADSCELLEVLANGGHDDARAVLERTLPVMRRDLARSALGGHAWGDTWALWSFARRPHALRRLHPFALAIADTYATRAIAGGGIGLGSRFPFHGKPMVSVSAQLATGLLALGTHPKLTGQLTAWVDRQAAGDGSFADADEPPDLLTTLVAAELLAGIDPAWDPAPTVRWFDGRRRVDGTLVAFGPEVEWLTIAVDDLVDLAQRPFSQRFRWPQLAVEQRDRRTALPFLGYLVDLARLFREIPSLASTPVDLAFLDLAGFGVWNNRFGMAEGDKVLRFLASELTSIPETVAIRDGGDEFVIVSAPGRTGLAETMAAFRTAFPRRFAERFGADKPPVAIRLVTTTTEGAGLVSARDRLGAEIAALKRAHPTPPPEGVSAVLS